MALRTLSPRRPGAAFLPFALLGSLTAQTPIGGIQTGTMPAGVYHAVSNLVVPAGQTLTLSAGVIIKFTNAYEFTVDGTLIANGTAANPVILTDVRDDSAGGDTNGNGPSTGVPAAWRGLVFHVGSGASALHWLETRYGGSGFVPNLTLDATNPWFDHCTSRNCYTHGMSLNGVASPTVANCTFADNGGYAVDGVPVNAVAGFTNNTAAGNNGGGGDYARVTVGGVSGALTLQPTNMINGAIVMDDYLVVPVGSTLTLAAGTVVKYRNGYELTVDGTLVANGTALAPVIVTDLRDDSAGGDTNGNGQSSGVPAAWRGIVFHSTSSGCALHHTEARFAGSGFVSGFHLDAANPLLDHCAARNCYTHGMNCSFNSAPIVTDCEFTGNGGFAIEGVPVNSLAAFTNNIAAGNNGGGGDYARVTVGGVTGALTLQPANMINGAIVIDDNLVVPVGSTLTLAAGTVIKYRNGYELTVDGTLLANGTAGSPVVVTDLRDDSVGGDTNGNGPSSGVPAAWRGIVFGATSNASTLHWLEARYGGSGFVANLTLNGADPTFDHCTSRNCYTHGMQLGGNSRPHVSECTFADNGSYAIDGVPIEAVPGFAYNHASGNGAGNFLRVTVASLSTPLVIGTPAHVNGAIVLNSNLHVLPGGDLTVQQGVVFKFQNAFDVTVDGALHVNGTGYEPVVFTDLRDDDFGGDTNGNGPSAGVPAGWRGIVIDAGAAATSLSHVVARYCGSGFVPAVSCASPAATLHAVRADRAYSNGIVLAAAGGTPSDLVAWGCGSYGIQLTGGAFAIAHATAAGNAYGIRREPAWTGTVVNSIARGNSSANFSNFPNVAQVLTSDGVFPGQNGNLDVDPLFADVTNGNLHLLPGSPCLGAADLVNAFFTIDDFDQNGRLLDHALIGLPLPDMGAFELGAWDMTVGGNSRLGSVFSYSVNGPAGVSFYLFGVLDGLLPVVPYGFFLAGGSPTLLAATPTNSTFFLPVPSIPGLVGLQVGVQALAFPTGTTAVGNLTRLHQILVRP